MIQFYYFVEGKYEKNFRQFVSSINIIEHFGLSVFSTPSSSQDSDLFLEMKDCSLFIDGSPLAEKQGTFGGRVVWFSLPKQGQFIISTSPQKGYKFEQIASVQGNIISFTLDGKFYQLTSTKPILSNSDAAKLWVFHDLGFQPKSFERGINFGSASNFEYFLEHRLPEKF